jgi:hypothetical protein
VLAYATAITRLSPLGFYVYLFLRQLREFIVVVWALSKCDKSDIAETVRALADYRRRK